MESSRSLIVAGVLSGTSADGISCVLSEISHSFLNEDGTKRSEQEPKIHIKELAFDTLPWSDKNRETIFRLFKAHDLSIAEVCEANFRLGEETAKVVLHTIARAGLKPEQVHLIGSHGQTVWHQVDDLTKNVTSTLQIGEPACIAELTGITTIADFRVADVAAGGQGAPLTSTLDWLLLRQPSTSQRWRALQNIGGIGNVTLLPPVGFSWSLSAVAFDTGPGNVLMDWFIQKKSNGALLFDEDGKFARSGSVNVELLSKMLQHPYFERKPPKTTGRELFSANLAEEWNNIRLDKKVSDEDFMATLTELTAVSIVDAYRNYLGAADVELLISGGGSRNLYLMERISSLATAKLGGGSTVSSHDTNTVIKADSKEANLFALLAYLCVNGIPGNVPACTAARHAAVLGKICPGKNFRSSLLRI